MSDQSDHQSFPGYFAEIQKQAQTAQSNVLWQWPVNPMVVDYTARLEAMRLAVQFSENELASDFPQTIKHAHTIYRFLTGQTCPTCGPEPEK